MERIFLKDIGKNFKKGQVKNYPRSVWEQIEKSAGEKLADFSSERNSIFEKAQGDSKIISKRGVN